MADDIAKAVAAGNTQGRRVVGPRLPDFRNASGQPERGFLRAKGDAAGGQLAAPAPTTKGRASAPDLDGASHTIKAIKPPAVVEAAPTQANGKIIPPSHRSGKNFWSQA